MTARRGWAAALLAGCATRGIAAQETPPPTVPAAPIEQKAIETGTRPRIEFRGADGKPLPPEVQRRLEEQFRKNPPPGLGGVFAPATAGDITVTAEKPRGAVVGNLPPERSFNQLDIRAYGADSIGALLEAIGPQVASNRGRADAAPVTLLNGRRISDFSEIARIPTEAIERMEVFPEELALRYGYRADQKVVNIVTFANFRSRVGQLGYLAPTDGGRDTSLGNADYLALSGDTRIGAGVSYNRAAALRESDRWLAQVADVPDLGRFRTLLPASEQIAVNGLISSRLAGDVTATLNGRFDATHSEALLGRDGAGALRRESDRHVAHLGTTLGGRQGSWQWTATGNFDRVASDIRTDVAGERGGRDSARFVDTLGNADVVLNGPIADLPAGPLSASVQAGVAFRGIDSRSAIGGDVQIGALARHRGAVQFDVDLPILARKSEAASPLGDLSLNANVAVERLSDAGTLRTFGYGLAWSPMAAVSLIASATHEEGAPTLEQLGGPLLVTPNVRTFDPVRREVVDIARLSGGNPGLRSDDRHVMRVGLNVKPLAKTDLTFSVDYVATRIDDPIAAFPIVTPAIEAAFPGRFSRDVSGRLVQVDGRPVNFVRSRQRQLRTGFNFTRPLGKVPPGYQTARTRVFSSEAEARRAMPGAIFNRAEPGSAGAQAAANLTSRVFVSLYHNWYLQDAIVLDERLPTLDLLDGGAIDFRGGRRRHEVEVQAGAFKRGLGGRISATWQSGTSLAGSAAAGDLRFASYATVNANLFANLAERFGGSSAPGWLKGTRASLGVTNLLNTRPQVRDRLGATPLSYQPAYLDPLGRTVSLSLRKTL
ncbi:MAG: TonB-dependent receptor [Sphingomonas taxi]